MSCEFADESICISQTSLQYNHVFERARDDFLASLSPSEKVLFTKCPSAEKLIVDVEKLGKARKDRLWGKRMVASVSALGESLKPYFDTIGIFVQSHPEYAAIVWGAFHLVFKLAANYTSFFTKLTITLDRIIQTLPHYDQIAALCTKGPSRRLQSSLCKVYEDLLRFCQSIVRVFTKEDGEAKRSIRVATGLLWKPFDARFEELLDDFRFHADLVKSELLLAELLETREGKETIASQIQEIKQQLARVEKERAARDTTLLSPQAVAALEYRIKAMTDTKIYDIQRWIDPPPFAQEFERARDQKEPGTAEWLMLEDLTTRWVNLHSSTAHEKLGKKFNERVVWVQGNPGCGKTVLAASTVEELNASRSSGIVKAQVFYFFFRTGLPNFQDPSAPLRSFVAQLFHAHHNNRDLVDRFAFIMDETSAGQLNATRSELLELLQLCIDHSRDVFFVIDGIDESEDAEAVTKDLLVLSSDPNVKLLILSRPNVGALFKTVPEEQRLNIGDKNHIDIETYVASRLEDLTDEELLPSSSDNSRLSEHLILGANGMFMWIRLMMNSLTSSALTRRQRVEAIMNIKIPEGLDTMYNRIAMLIQGSNKAERNLAQRIFAWLLYSKRPLTAKELQVAISQEATLSANDDDDFADFRRTVIMSCAGLVELQTTATPTFLSDITSFQFIHLSVREYLTSLESGEACNNYHGITIGRSESLIEISNRCIASLTYGLPTQPLSGSPDSNTTPTQVHAMFPFVGYATCHWIDHLEDISLQASLASEKFLALLHTIFKFLSLSRTLISYIETSYVFRVIPSASRLNDWSRRLNSPECRVGMESNVLAKVIDDTLELSHFLGVIQEEWGGQLLESPICVWEEVTAFTRSRLIAQTGSTQVRTLIKEAPKMDSISSRYLSKISELSEDGKTEFEVSAQSSMKPVESMVHILCTNWVARYELWTVADDPKCIADGCIPLDANEIHLQVQRSMWQDDPSFTAGHWKIQFPIAISPDTSLVCIIRTVYLFSVTKSNEALMHAVLLPLHLEANLETIWPKLEELQKQKEVPETPKHSQKLAGTGFRNSLTGLLQPGTRHKRSKSLPREEMPVPDIKRSGSTRSRLWSRSFSRPHTPESTAKGNDFRRYRYWISFAHHGAYLLFVDNLQVDNSSTAGPSNVVLFSIDTRAQLKIVRTNSTRDTFCPLGQMHPPKVLFHPHEALLAFFFPRVEYHSPVILWPFSQARSTIIEIYRTAQVSWNGETVEDVHFSRDGQHLVVQISTSKAPEVIPIDFYLTSRDRFYKSDNKGVANDMDSSLTMTPTSGPTIHLPNDSTSTVFKPHTQVTDSGNASGFNVIHTGRQITIRRWANEGENNTQQTKEEVLQLTRLPAWGSLASSSAAVSMPRPGDNKVRIVLNRSARQWEDMVQDVDAHLPALVSRDIASLQIQDSNGQKRTLGGSDTMQLRYN